MSRTIYARILEKVKFVLPDDKDHFCCALTCDVMDVPVIDPRTLNPAALLWISASSAEKAILDCGNFKEVPRYDRTSLQKLIASTGTGISPSTRLLFTAQELIPDTKLNSEIDLFMKPFVDLLMHPSSEKKSRLDIEAEVEAAFSYLNARFRFFLSRGLQGAAIAGQRIPSDTVNPILQQVVYGEESKVIAALEAATSNPAQLTALLSNTGTVKDYSDRTFTDMTLLQVAAAAGDVEMCEVLRSCLSPEEFANQLVDIFPDGIEAHEEKQKRNTFNFDAILTAIRTASTPDLDAALDTHIQDNDSALSRALEEFRRQFTEISNTEKIFNPQHLLRAFEVYNELWDPLQLELGGGDGDYKKRHLFWRQIIGYIQRFMPACYAQAFAQGLRNLVKVDQDVLWRPEPFNRALNLAENNYKLSFFPLPVDSRSGRLGFEFAIFDMEGAAWARGAFGPQAPVRISRFSKAFVEQKQQAFRTLWRECESSHGRRNVAA